jgi:hypothetical protein
LKAAADEKGVSLSQEIEQRIAGYLADPEIYRLAIEIAALVANIERQTGRKTTQDAYTLDAVLAGMKSLLAAKRVPGPAVVPEAVKQRTSHRRRQRSSSPRQSAPRRRRQQCPLFGASRGQRLPGAVR